MLNASTEELRGNSDMNPTGFTVPEGYEDFVSSTEELMRQFQMGCDVESECVEYSIYVIDGTSANFQDVDYLCELRHEIMRFVSGIYCDYVWHCDGFALSVVKDEEGRAVLIGKTRLGDSVDDEWFIVYILMQISTKFYGVAISVKDSDGEFLLIEAAEYIPTWLGPGNSANRVWLRGGKVHLIPFEEVGTKVDGTLGLSCALSTLLSGRSTVADQSVQACIAHRIEAFPRYAFACMHSTVCTIPRTIARMLKINPQLISTAVSSFCKEHKGKREMQTISAMKKFGTDLADLVCVPVKMARVHFAKLSFQSFHPPRKFHAAMLQSVDTSAASRKRFDMGARITCGFEIAYQSTREKDTHFSDTAFERTLSKYLEGLKNIGYFDESMECTGTKSSISQAASRCLRERLISSNYELDLDSTLRNALNSVTVPLAFHLQIDYLEATQGFNDLEVTPMVLDATDSEDWLYMTPEELDAEMLRRVGKEFTVKSSCTPKPEPLSNGATGTDETQSDDFKERRMGKENEEMSKIVSELKTFMNLGSSDFEGIEPVPTIERNSAQEVLPASAHNFDIDRFISILGKEVNGNVLSTNPGNGGEHVEDEISLSDDDNDNDIDSSGGGDVNDDEAVLKEIDSFYANPSNHSISVDGVGSFVISSTADEYPNNIDVDSDDEIDNLSQNKGRENIKVVGGREDGSDGEDLSDFDDPQFMQDYMDAMNRELGMSTLGETFEKDERQSSGGTGAHSEEDCSLGNIDIDLNLLKNMLESHALQVGGSGPASALLAQLGLSFPRGERAEDVSIESVSEM